MNTTDPPPEPRSFWLDGLRPTEPEPRLQGEGRCDVAIIGGGFTGLSTAFHTRQRLPDADVRVVEAGRCATGASGRSGGFCTTLFGLTKGFTALRFGRERAIAAHRYMEAAAEYVASLIRDHAIDCDYERPGTVLVATTEAQRRRVEAQWRVAQDWGLAVERWDAARLAEELHTGEPLSLGLFDPSSGLLDPARFARGLLDLALDSGATVHEDSPVLAVEETPGGYRIRTEEGLLHAARVVFATNAYAVPGSRLAAKQTPVLSHIVVTEPLTAEQLAAIGWRSRVGFEDARNMMHYVRLTADNRILLGGGGITPVFGAGIHRTDRPAIHDHLERRLLTLFPQLRGIGFSHRWGGPVSLTLDMAPVVGRVGRGGLFAAGLMGHGVSMAPYNGLCLAELLAGEQTVRTEAFFVGRRVWPWPPEGLRRPLLHAARGVMQLEDRLRWG